MNKIVYLSGGRFWGLQAYFDKIKGVLETEAGYANGITKKTTYDEVCNGSGHAEVVKVAYDDSIIISEIILSLYIRAIDPLEHTKQGKDDGYQYRTGIYTSNQTDYHDFHSALQYWETYNLESEVEIEELKNYCPAETYHQKYLEKNPKGYCYIDLNDIPEKFSK